VEVGYTNFFFYRSERSQRLILTETKKERLKKIVIEAVEQAGRAKIPEIVFLEKLEFNDIKNSENIVFDTNNISAVNFKDLRLAHKDVNIFI
jgi:RsmE family RNA methyltransferase